MDFVKFYSEELRNTLFTGTLTMGTFLFAVKTFIIVKIKEEVYDADFYHERLNLYRKFSQFKDKGHYHQLRNLSGFLFWATFTSFLSAIVQLTLGLVKNPYASWSCVTIAAIAITLMIISLFLVKANIKDWLNESEKQVQKKRTENLPPPCIPTVDENK